MKIPALHPWNLTVSEAVEIQRRLSNEVREEPVEVSAIQFVAGADVSFDRRKPRIGFGAVCIFSFPECEILETISDIVDVDFPYIPGLLSFRESPVLLRCFEKISRTPDVVLVDAQGRAHPRRFGAASHLGVLLDLPTIGCAKTRLVGEYAEPGISRGSYSDLYHRGEKVGVVLRTQDRVEPVFVSVGNKVDIPSAIHIIQACAISARIPKPLRIAHQECNRLRSLFFASHSQTLFP